MAYSLEKKVRLAVQKMSYNNGNKEYYYSPYQILEMNRPENRSENPELAVHIVKDQKLTLIAPAINSSYRDGGVNLYTGNIGEFYRLSTGGGIVNLNCCFNWGESDDKFYVPVIPVNGQADSDLSRYIAVPYSTLQLWQYYKTMCGLQPFSMTPFEGMGRRIETQPTPVATTELTLYFKRVRDVYEQSKIIGNVVSINGETYSPQQFLNVFGDYLVPVRQPNDSGYLGVGKALRVYNDSDMPSYDKNINSIDAFSCCPIRKKTDEEAETISNRDLECYALLNQKTYGIQPWLGYTQMIETLWAAPRVFYKKDALTDGSIRNSQANYSFGQCINPAYQMSIRKYNFHDYNNRKTPDEMLCWVNNISEGEALYFSKVKVHNWELPDGESPRYRAIVQRFYDNNLSSYTEYQRYANNHLMYGDLYEEEHFNTLQRHLEFRYNGDGLNSNYRTSIQVFNQDEIEKYLHDLGYTFNYYHDWVTSQGLTFRKIRREDTILLTTATARKIRR